MAPKRQREGCRVDTESELFQGLSIPREEDAQSPYASQTHTSSPQSFPDLKRWTRGEGTPALRMHATLHPNFQRLRPSSPHTHLRKSEPRASPSPSGFPRAAPSPPLQHRSGRQGGFQPGTAAVLFSSASPGSRSPRPGSAASGCARDRPFPSPSPPPPWRDPWLRA